jgi:hypothetical protein
MLFRASASVVEGLRDILVWIWHGNSPETLARVAREVELRGNIVKLVHITASLQFMFGSDITSIGVDEDGDIHVVYAGGRRRIFMGADVDAHPKHKV